MNVESTGLNFQNQNISKSFFVAAILTEDSDIDIVNPAIDEVRKMRWAIYRRFYSMRTCISVANSTHYQNAYFY